MTSNNAKLSFGKKKFGFAVPSFLKSKTKSAEDELADPTSAPAKSSTDLPQKSRTSLFSRVSKSRLGTLFGMGSRKAERASADCEKTVEEEETNVELVAENCAGEDTGNELNEEKAAVKIQANYKAFKGKQTYDSERKKIILVQSLARRFLARRRVQNLKTTSQTTPEIQMDEIAAAVKEQTDSKILSAKELGDENLITLQ